MQCACVSRSIYSRVIVLYMGAGAGITPVVVIAPVSHLIECTYKRVVAVLYIYDAAV